MRANYGMWTLMAVLCQASWAMAADAVRWAPSLDAACQTAARSNRLVLVHFYTNSCVPCRAVDRFVFSQPMVADTIDKAYVAVKINAEQQPNIAEQLKVDRFPTDIMMTPAGYPVHRTVSPQSPEAYIAELRIGVSEAIKIYKAEALAKRNAAPPAAPLPYAPPAATAANPAYPLSGGGTPIATTRFDAPPPAAASPAGQFAPPAPNDPRFNPGLPSNYREHQPVYAGGQPPAPSGPVATPPNFAPPAAAVASAPTSVPASVPAWPGFQAAPGPQIVVNPTFPGAANPPPQGPPPGAGSAVIDPRVAAASASLPAAPDLSISAGNPPIGIEGFCPVTLAKTEKWIKGNTKWGAVHRGRTYLFKSEADQKEYLQNPDLFSPMLSGFDAVKFKEQGLYVPGKRQLGIFYGKQMYFFADEDALKRFWSAPERFAPTARQAMAQGAGDVIRQ